MKKLIIILGVVALGDKSSGALYGEEMMMQEYDKVKTKIEKMDFPVVRLA